MEKKYYLFNSENFILGRMSSKIAFLLQGKNFPNYAPNKIGEYFVIVTNTDKLLVSGRKITDKKYHTFSGYPGGITSRSLGDIIESDSCRVIWNSVYGMLPKNKLRETLMKKLLIFKDENHGINKSKIEEINPIQE